ncbi:hypothetical protein ABEF95_001898 [Exophiala dermatitidis]
MADQTPIVVSGSGPDEAGAGAGGIAGAGIGIGQGMSIPFRPRRRPRRKLRDNILGITKPTIRRLARRGGIPDMDDEVYDTVRDVVKATVTEIIERLAVLMRHPPVNGPEQLPPLEDGSKIVTTVHVLYVLKQMRILTPLYGHGVDKPRPAQPEPRLPLRA